MKMKRLGKKGKAKSQICHPSNVLQLMPILFEFENQNKHSSFLRSKYDMKDRLQLL